ncbi:hypothetical protein FG386_003560 [Cryptosporidium ryanae]|uniref:uncharacterized protein n=1 Tax=Cryptosporidium ryanae TaxID=515981 RepID=UPI003519EC07|nr:hypothetical protein FG386_003560 [Cryptosporidium ryanae]
MSSTKLVEKPSFKLDLRKLNPDFEIEEYKERILKKSQNNKNNANISSSLRNSEEYYIEKLRQIEEENIKLREINEQLSRSLSMTTRSTSLITGYNPLQNKNLYSRYFSSINEQIITTSRSMLLNLNMERNLKATVSNIIGERSEVALSVLVSNEEYFLGLDPIHESQSARVVLSKIPSYWRINKIPQFWEGFFNIMSSVVQKGFLNTLSYWSFLRAPPSPKKNVRRWEGITIKYQGPLKEYKGYSLAGNDDGLFVYLQSEEDAYDNIFYCNFRRRKAIPQTESNSETRKNILNLLHANTRSYICIDTKAKNEDKIMIKLSESKRNKLMFEEVDATELLTKQLLRTAEQISQEMDQSKQDFVYYDNTPSRLDSKGYIRNIPGTNFSQEEGFTSRTVEPCISIEREVMIRNNSLADELSFETSSIQQNKDFMCDRSALRHKFCELRINDQINCEMSISCKNESNISNNSNICSPRIRASNVINDKVIGIDYHEVPLTKRLNVVYIPSTTAVLVHDLVDSEEDDKINSISECENISDAEQEYFKANK